MSFKTLCEFWAIKAKRNSFYTDYHFYDLSLDFENEWIFLKM